MKCSFDTIVVGAGLAGACSALSLSESESVLLVDAKAAAAGASGIGAGLVNPLMARRATPAWRVYEALEAVRDLGERVGVAVRQNAVLRSAGSDRQAGFFKAKAQAHPDLAEWVGAERAARRWPWLSAAHGVLIARGGGWCPMPDLVRGIVAAARAQGCRYEQGLRLESWEEAPDSVDAAFSDGSRLTARRLLLCMGAETATFDTLAGLRIHRVKGQAVRLRRPHGMPSLLPVSSKGYVIDEGQSVFVGSTYEHDFEHANPTEKAGRTLRRRAARAIPALNNAEIIEQFAAVRATVPRSRTPLIGPLPESERVWVFTGLGSRGLLLAPLLSRQIHHYFQHLEAIPPPCRLARRTGNR